MESVFGQQEKSPHKQGANWTVVGCFEEFEVANERRNKEINEGRLAKVHRLASGYVVKVKPSSPPKKEEVAVETKKAKPAGKQKRQDRFSKR